MCLIVFAYRVHPDFPLIVAANRDEFHARPTALAAWWADYPSVFAGRDLQGGGTWMGVTRAGRFAALTNARSPAPKQTGDAPSRGLLVANFLTGEASPRGYAHTLAPQVDAYNGFNLLTADFNVPTMPLVVWSPQSANIAPQALAPGVYGLSNAALNTPWPKLTRSVDAVRTILQAALQGSLPQEALLSRLFTVMADETQAPPSALPDTGLEPARERILSAVKIVDPTYGTRASTVLLIGADRQIVVRERRFDVSGKQVGEERVHFQM